MENKMFKEGTIVKGKDLKGYIFYKILPENMTMKGFQYKMGMNEIVKPSAKWMGRAGLQFFFIWDICNYLYHGIKLAIVSIPDDEDVYIGRRELSTHKLVIEKVFSLNDVLSKVTGWECLILNGADITANNNCAVGWAAQNGYLEVVEFYIKNGADITAWDNAAVRYAAQNGYLEVVKYLHEHGANITVRNNYAVTQAAGNGHLEVVKYLHEHGADITDNNDTVRYATENGYLEVVKYLHEHGANITKVNNDAVRIAARNGYFEIVRYLYEHGADITAMDNDAVYHAVKYGHMDIAEYLKKKM